MTFPISGMTRRGQLLPLEMSAHHIGAKESSYSQLPSLRASDGKKGGPNQRGSSGDLMLPSAVMVLLPSPVAQQSGSTPEEHLARKPGRTQVTDLAIIVENGLM